MYLYSSGHVWLYLHRQWDIIWMVIDDSLWTEHHKTSDFFALVLDCNILPPLQFMTKEIPVPFISLLTQNRRHLLWPLRLKMSVNQFRNHVKTLFSQFKMFFCVTSISGGVSALWLIRSAWLCSLISSSVFIYYSDFSEHPSAVSQSKWPQMMCIYTWDVLIYNVYLHNPSCGRLIVVARSIAVALLLRNVIWPTVSWTNLSWLLSVL